MIISFNLYCSFGFPSVPVVFQVHLQKKAKGPLAHAHQNASRSRHSGEERHRQSGFLTSSLNEENKLLTFISKNSPLVLNSQLLESKFI